MVTVNALPGESQQIALADLWEEIAAFAATIPQLPLVDILSQLEDYKEKILEILEVQVAATGVAPDDVTPTPSATPTDGASPTSTTFPTTDPTTAPTTSTSSP